jgi:hypothetical protein
VAFNLQQEFGLTVTGTFSFAADWRVPGSKYIVRGISPDKVILQSDPIDVPPTGDNVLATKFKLHTPSTVIAPFKAEGEWKWIISHQTPTG